MHLTIAAAQICFMNNKSPIALTVTDGLGHITKHRGTKWNSNKHQHLRKAIVPVSIASDPTTQKRCTVL